MSELLAWLSSYGPRIEIALETAAIVILAFVAGIWVNRMLRRSLIERYRHRRLPYETVLLLTRGATALVWLFGLGASEPTDHNDAQEHPSG